MFKDDEVDTIAAAVTDIFDIDEANKTSMDLRLEEEEPPIVAEDSYFFPPRNYCTFIN